MILPRPDRSFEWRDTPFGPALVCTPLEGVAPHLFTTRQWSLGQVSHPGDGGWAEVSQSLGAATDAVVRLHQVHGRTAVVAEGLEPKPHGHLPEGDIIVTSEEDCVIAVQAADCVPLLIGDRRLGVVAAAHAGWRGLALGGPGAAVQALADTYGSRSVDLIAAIGPSVSACCYEIGPEVRQAFEDAGFGGEVVRRWFSNVPTPSQENPSMKGIPERPRRGHAFFDGWVSAVDQLIAAGVPETQVFCARLCTASHPDVLCSYRRDGTSARRIAGAIRRSRRR